MKLALAAVFLAALQAFAACSPAREIASDQPLAPPAAAIAGAGAGFSSAESRPAPLTGQADARPGQVSHAATWWYDPHATG